jgi:hypothetical protein
MRSIIALVITSLSGCAVYDGAIYSSYQQYDLSIRSQPATATPMQLNLGYDRAVVSFVPHRDDQKNGEAVSLFGLAHTELVTPSKVLSAAEAEKTGSLLKAQGKFATGNAAMVLVIPEDKNVVIKRDGRADIQVKLKGDVSKRVNAVFKPTTQFGDPDTLAFNQIMEKINRCSDKNKIYTDAATRVDNCFSIMFKKRSDITDVAKRFKTIKIQYEVEPSCPGSDDEKINKVTKALNESFKSNCNITEGE